MMDQFYWHIHHEILCEPLREPIEERIAYIKKDKPSNERALRLRLLKPVHGQLPSVYAKACAAYHEARAAWEKAWVPYHEAWPALQEAAAARHESWPTWEKAAWVAHQKRWTAHHEAKAAWDEAGAAYDEACAALHEARAAWLNAWAACKPEIEALHRTECPDCTWDGTTILLV